MTIDLRHLFLIKVPTNILSPKKETLVHAFFYAAIVIAFYGSLNPWFMWPLGQYYVLPACAMALLALGIAETMEEPIFNKNDFLISLCAYIMLVFYQNFVNENNIKSFIYQIFHIIVFYAIFHMNFAIVKDVCNWIAKSMGYILAISIPAFLLYILGFPLPYTNANFGEMYSYSNYYFFLIDDRSLLTIIPRFNSVFLEPGQLGTATALLLMTQIGSWKKWYNVLMIIATLISFSLSAYVLFVAIIFLALWIQGKNIIKKLLAVVTIIAAIVVGSFFYNDGQNLVHDLIVIRLEVEDGELVGDNRLRSNFQSEYESFLQSSDIIFGRNFEREWGSAGYRLYFYDYGLVGLMLLGLFYGLSLKSKYKKAYLSALIIGTMNFMARDFSLWYAFYLPLYCVANSNVNDDNAQTPNPPDITS